MNWLCGIVLCLFCDVCIIDDFINRNVYPVYASFIIERIQGWSALALIETVSICIPP